ncbi:MAG TPA: response regulator [Planctomycetaceae bacterium]|nr:response regulator [Planctomycetaceae bacterium]
MGIQRPKILLIDDDPDFLKLLTTLLRRDYFVITASTGSDGCEKAKGCQPHLIMCDVHMPSGWDGLTTVKKLKEVPALTRVPIFMLTADARSHVAQAALEAGVSGYIRKDCLDRDDLMERIEQAVAGAQSVNAD